MPLSDRKKNHTMRESYKASAINIYSNGDACCKWCGNGDIDVLCLDHINDDGKKDSNRGHNFYRLLRKYDYPSGLQVLCASCNLKKEIVRKRTLMEAKGGY